MANNTQSIVGSYWSSSATNYSSARFFGGDLILPTAGYRNYYSGSLNYRGSYGFYWSSSQLTSYDAWYLRFYSSSAYTNYGNRRIGFSVRCVAE